MREGYLYERCHCVIATNVLQGRGLNRAKEGMNMWIVRYGGWTIWEGDDEEKAMEEYRACGPYGTIREVKE